MKILAFLALASVVGLGQQPPPKQVVFVCEHGAAKSVIAAAYFNKLAAERHLNYQAIARGTTPQEELSTSAVAGLKRDAVPFPASDKPKALTPAEAKGATRVVAFCPLPAALKPPGAEIYDVPGPSPSYDQSRDAILVRVRALLDDLQKQP